MLCVIWAVFAALRRILPWRDIGMAAVCAGFPRRGCGNGMACGHKAINVWALGKKNGKAFAHYAEKV